MKKLLIIGLLILSACSETKTSPTCNLKQTDIEVLKGGKSLDDVNAEFKIEAVKKCRNSEYSIESTSETDISVIFYVVCTNAC